MHHWIHVLIIFLIKFTTKGAVFAKNKEIVRNVWSVLIMLLIFVITATMQKCLVTVVNVNRYLKISSVIWNI